VGDLGGLDGATSVGDLGGLDHYLDASADRSRRPSEDVGLLPWHLVPGDLPVAAGAYLSAAGQHHLGSAPRGGGWTETSAACVLLDFRHARKT
jgi:hypothetical protein